MNGPSRPITDHTSGVEETGHPAARGEGWDLTEEALGKLLASFDADRERAGEKYEQVRRGLVYFFECRGSTFPEDHADETINRVARKLAVGEQIRDPYTYVYGVARLILLEIFKRRERERAALDNLPAPVEEAPGDTEEDEAARESARCLRRCLDRLPAESRAFITQYYRGEKRAKIENRQRLAEQLRIPLNALRLRARRVREKLEVCVAQCLNK